MKHIDLQETKHQLQLDKWRELVKECRSSGMLIKDWCEQRGICRQTYYRWQKQVWEAGTLTTKVMALPTKEITFAEYVPPIEPLLSATAVVLHLSCGRLEIQHGADQATIENTLKAISKIC